VLGIERRSLALLDKLGHELAKPAALAAELSLLRYGPFARHEGVGEFSTKLFGVRRHEGE
jgi:hypothetical protein